MTLNKHSINGPYSRKRGFNVFSRCIIHHIRHIGFVMSLLLRCFLHDRCFLFHNDSSEFIEKKKGPKHTHLAM